MKSQSAGAGCLLILGLMVALGMGFIDYQIAANLRRQLEARSWPKVVATMDSSRVFVDDSGDGVSYIPKISYHYQVGGRSYVGDRVRWGFNFTTRKWADQVVALRPVGGQLLMCNASPDGNSCSGTACARYMWTSAWTR